MANGNGNGNGREGASAIFNGVRSLFIGKSGASPHSVFRYLECGPRSRRRRNTSISFAA